MESFRWDQCFVTGLSMVDEQHHHLVDVINAFGELLMQPEGTSVAEIERVFAELARYAEYHFSEEERLMERSRIDPRYIAAHHQEHIRFLQDVTALHAGLADGNRVAASNLLSYLTNWLAYHILGSDQVMARAVAAIAAGAAPEDVYASGETHRDPATAMLLHSMHTLFNQVSEQNRTLSELNRTLEARVAERTHELLEANQRLEDMAMTDVLTGLPNRRHAMRICEQEWHTSVTTGKPLACMMIDADGFKGVNDVYGHDAGDEVLRQLARRLQHAVRTDDTVCRLGGDEFLIVCAHTPLQGALRVAEKARQEVAALHVPVGKDGAWHGSISVGVAVRVDSMTSIHDLLKTADEAVYAAKRNGRNCVATA